MTEHISFFSQGKYGCVTHPAISCKNKKSISNFSSSVSKIVINDFYAKNEINVGILLNEVLKKPLYSSMKEYFLIYTEYCLLKNNELKNGKNQMIQNKCKLIDTNLSDEEFNNKFVALYGKYVPSTTLFIYLKQQPSWDKLFHFYKFSLQVCRTLNKINLIHYDLKETNFLHESKTNKFYIIDFGFSLQYDKCFLENELNMKYLKHFFIYAPEYVYWSLDHNIISYIIKYIKVDFTEKSLKEIIDESYKHRVFQNDFCDDLTAYKNDCFLFFKEILFTSSMKTNEDRISFLLIKYAKTWDLYSICVICLKTIVNNLKSDCIINKNSFVSLLKNGMHYDYSVRPSLTNHMSEFFDMLSDE